MTDEPDELVQVRAELDGLIAIRNGRPLRPNEQHRWNVLVRREEELLEPRP